MSCIIKLSDISQEKREIICNGLTLQPKIRKFGYNQEDPEPIIFYQLKDECLYLPFLFAAGLFQIIPNINNQYPTVNLNFTGQLRDYQIKVEQEAWGQMSTYGTTTLGLYPGFGKTILGASLAARVKKLVCVIVHRELLLVQWKNTFTENTNARCWIVGEKNPPPLCEVIICLNTRWDHIPETLRKMVGTLIIDEADRLCTRSNVACLLAFQPLYIIVETASLERDDEMHRMIQAMVGEHAIHRDSTKPFQVVKVNTNTKPISKMNRFGKLDYNSLVESICNDLRRNQIILNLVLPLINNKILILTKLVNHVTLLHDALRHFNVPCDEFYGTKKNYQDSAVLVGSFSKLGVGFDPKSFCDTYDGRPFNILFIVSSIKKFSMLIQIAGRCFRAEYPTIYHLTDDHQIIRNHWYICNRWYKSRNGTVIDYNIPHQNNENTNNNNRNDTWIADKLTKLKAQKQLQLNVVP